MKSILTLLLIIVSTYSFGGIQLVTNTNDNGAGSLRDAISVSASGDSILFSPSLISGGNDTILLTSGNISFNKSLTILGLITAFDTLFVSGNNSSNIFTISGGTTILDKMAIVNGNSSLRGGGISSTATLTVKNSFIANNQAFSTSFTTRGGGIYSIGDLTVINSTLINNAVFNSTTASCYGGGIYCNGKLTVSNSAIINNRAAGGGGASSAGGGIWVSSSSPSTIDNTFISENSASAGGGIYSSTLLTITNSTISKNAVIERGGGIYTETNLIVKNSVIKENIDTGYTSLTIILGGGGIYANTCTVTIDSSSIIKNTNTAPRRTWGGGISGFSCTVAISNSSVSNNSSSSLTTQSRGGGVSCYNCSVTISNSSISNNSSTSQSNVSHGGGMFLQNSVVATTITNSQIDSNHASSDSSYSYNNQAYGGGIYSEGKLIIKKSSFNGNSCSSNQYPNLTTTTYSSSNGGGIYVDEYMSIDSSSISGNTNSSLKRNYGSSLGGGICSTDTLILTNSIISFNSNLSSDSRAGGIYTTTYSELANCIISNNSNSYDSANFLIGGGVVAERTAPFYEDSISVSNCIINNNTNFSSSLNYFSQANGGGMYIRARLSISNSDISNNSNFANNTNAGGVHFENSSSAPTLTNVTISKNSNNSSSSRAITLYSRGAGIYLEHNTLGIDIRNVTISENTNISVSSGSSAEARGSAIYANNAPISIINSTLVNNTNSATSSSSSASATGGVYTTNTVTTGSSIIALNTGGSNIVGSMNSIGYNIFSNSPFGSITTDQTFVNSSSLNLDTLKMNGGFAPTILPQLGSVAINMGNPSDLSNAQNRAITLGRRDVGAAETSGCPFTFVFDSICAGNTYSFDGNLLSTTGTYYDTILTSTGCDSIITLNLFVNSISTYTDSIIGCDSYLWAHNGQTYTSDTTVIDTIFGGNSRGCDSICYLKLTLNNSTSSSISVTTCDQYVGPSGKVFTTTGAHLDTIPNSVGCDSVLTINLTVINSTSSSVSATVCNSYTSITSKIYTTSGIYFDTIPNSIGCDSIITTNLTVNTSTFDTDSLSTCDSYTWSYNGLTYLNDTVIRDTLFAGNSKGCDSIGYLNLTIKKTTTNSITIITCDSFIAPSGKIITSNGLYFDTILNNKGCDSIISITLVVNHSSSFSTSVSACDNYLSASGKTYTLSGTYLDTIPNFMGCDSIITTILTINKSTFDLDTIVACDSYVWSYNGIAYLNDTIIRDTLFGGNSNGCDSIGYLDLTITNSSTSTLSDTACNQYIAPSGKVFSLSGTYLDTIPNSVGCDSLISINLIVKNYTLSSSSVTTCNSFVSITGKTYFSSGTYQDTIPNATGCDTIITTILTVNYSSTHLDSIVVCDSYLWAYNSQTYLKDTTIRDTIIAGKSNGCDSISVLKLTIYNSSSSTITNSVCNSFTSPSGKIFTTTGTYLDTISNAGGCDSLLTFNLTINSSSQFMDSVEACFSYTWINDGQTYLNDTVVHDTLVAGNSDGCDSINTMKITIKTIDTSVSLSYPNLTANENSASYQWLDCNNSYIPILLETNQSYSILSNGSYAVELTKNGCVDTSSCQLINNVGLNEANGLDKISIYPNPTSDILNIDLGSISNATISIYDISGKLIENYGKIMNSSFDINLSQYQEGLYLVKVNKGDSTKTFRVIKIQ